MRVLVEELDPQLSWIWAALGLFNICMESSPGESLCSTLELPELDSRLPSLCPCPLLEAWVSSGQQPLWLGCVLLSWAMS